MGRARPGVSVLYAASQGRQLLVAGRPTEVGGLEQGLRVAQLQGTLFPENTGVNVPVELVGWWLPSLERLQLGALRSRH